MATTASNVAPLAVPPRRTRDYSQWTLLLLLSVWFTPTLKMPGNIPLRLDELMVASVGGLMLARFILRLRLRKIDSVSWVPVTMAVSMLLSAIFATVAGQLPIGPKEYLDLARPISFLIVYLAVRASDPNAMLSSIRTTFRGGIVGLAICALVQFLLLSPSSSGPLASFFLLYTDLASEQARSFFGLRPFATFQTPTDLGYVMTVFLLAELILFSWRKWGYVLLALVGLLLSNTRTFLFAAPVLLLLYAVIYAKNMVARIRLLILGTGGILVGAALLLYVAPMVNATFATNTIRTTTSLASGDYSQDESIAIRLQKLALITYTWQHAPFFGVGSREMLGVAADSEYVYTFNRYGLIGILELMTLYVAGLWVIRILKRRWLSVYTFAVLMLAATFFYGFTQGALINVRVGIVPMVVLGYASGLAKRERAEAGLKSPAIFTQR
jgi:O-Antigen ligase